MKQPAISVIVPIYNVEPWLHTCVDSLLRQSFADFELILVDDGSPDGCGAICDAYAEKDSRVRVLHRANGGLSAARNSGIAVATGAYLAFVDSDDFVHTDYLKRLYSACQTTGADMAVCGFEAVNEDGTTPQPPAVTRPKETGVFAGKQLLPEFCTQNQLFYTVAWNKLYAAHLWQALRYPVGMIHEDDAVAPHLYHACTKVACLDDVLLHYRQRQGSIVRSAIKPSSFDAVTVRANWCHFFAQHNAEAPVLDTLVAACWRRYLWCCYAAGQVPLTWALAARWHSAQSQMLPLLPLAMRCRALSLREKLSCLRWGKRPLPMPARDGTKRIALLLPPGLPVPAVKGGAAETLCTHLVQQNQTQKQLQLAVCCEWNAEAAEAACRYPETLFRFQTPPQGRSLAHSLRYHAGRLLGKPIHWNRWYAQPLPFLRLLNADTYLAEGGDLTGWQQASRLLGQNRFACHLHGKAQSAKAVQGIYSRVISISDYVSREWLSTSDMPPQSVVLVPNCVDTALFCPQPTAPTERQALRAQLGLSADDFVVLFCGRTCPEKGIHKLVQAFGQLSTPSARLVVVGSPFFGAQGDSPFFADLQRNAAALGNRIVFTGFVHNSRLPAYYRMADLACFPAVWEEPAGITAIEAMACGCPVLATQSGGMPEYLQGSKAVLLPRSEACFGGECIPLQGVRDLALTLAESIDALASDPARRAAMGAAGVGAAARYSAQAYYQRFVSAL